MYLDARYLLSRDLFQVKAGAAAILRYKKKKVIKKNKILTTFFFFSYRLWELQDRVHFYYRFQEKAKENPKGIFVIFEGREYTFQEIERCRSHKLLDNPEKKKNLFILILPNLASNRLVKFSRALFVIFFSYSFFFL